MPEINWNLLNPAAVGKHIMDGFEQGQKLGSEMRLRRALRSYADNPDDRDAYATIMQEKPELAIKLRQDADGRNFNSALGDYLAPPQRTLVPNRPGATQPMLPSGAPQNMPPVAGGALSRSNALSGMVGHPGATPPPQAGALNALMPQSGPSTGGALSGLTGGALGQGGPTPQMPGIVSGYGGGTFDTRGRQVTPPDRERDLGAGQVEDNGPDLTFLGEPKTARDQAFLRMVRHDPVKALKIQSTLRDNFLDQLKDSQSFYGIAVEELARVRDDAGWQVALGRLAPYAERLGVDLGESVPLTYPGDQEVAALMERAMPIKDRLGHLLRSTDVAEDNARADRNTDSVISDRQARLDEARRRANQSDATRRRGQDATATTSRRGQDIRGARGGERENIPTVKTPEEARKLAPGTKFKTPDGRIKVR